VDIIQRPAFNFNLSITGFSLRLQVETTLVDPISKQVLGPPESFPPGDGDRIYSPKRCALNER
jgi:hypothetical protein